MAYGRGHEAPDVPFSLPVMPPGPAQGATQAVPCCARWRPVLRGEQEPPHDAVVRAGGDVLGEFTYSEPHGGWITAAWPADHEGVPWYLLRAVHGERGLAVLQTCGKTRPAEP